MSKIPPLIENSPGVETNGTRLKPNLNKSSFINSSEKDFTLSK